MSSQPSYSAAIGPRYAGSVIVVKYGGHALAGGIEGEGLSSFAADVVALKRSGVQVIVVHGGGPQIGAMLKRLGIESRFIDGLRVTDAATMEVAAMVLAGGVNQAIVAAINMAGGSAVGLTGRDADLIRVEKAVHPAGDLGFVGEPVSVNAVALRQLAGNFIPVIAPIGAGPERQPYNINADTAAGAIAAAMEATRLLFLTDVAGVLDAGRNLIPEMSAAHAETLIADGTIHGGMIPKIRTCLDAVAAGVRAAVILDGRAPHALLRELGQEGGAGTLIGQV